MCPSNIFLKMDLNDLLLYIFYFLSKECGSYLLRYSPCNPALLTTFSTNRPEVALLFCLHSHIGRVTIWESGSHFTDNLLLKIQNSKANIFYWNYSSSQDHSSFLHIPQQHSGQVMGKTLLWLYHWSLDQRELNQTFIGFEVWWKNCKWNGLISCLTLLLWIVSIVTWWGWGSRLIRYDTLHFAGSQRRVTQTTFVSKSDYMRRWVVYNLYILGMISTNKKLLYMQ